MAMNKFEGITPLNFSDNFLNPVWHSLFYLLKGVEVPLDVLILPLIRGIKANTNTL